MKVHVKSRYLALSALLVALVLTVSYLLVLTTFLPHSRLKMTSGLTISEYYFIPPGDIVWSDENFATGWAVVLTTSKQNDSGFMSNNSGGYLYYNFTGGGRVEAIEIEKKVSIDTSVDKYLTVEFNASTDDRSICFSSAVIAKDGAWIGLPWNHVSKTKRVLVFDLTNYYSGQIVAIRFRITNDYNRNYAGGHQAVSITFVSVSKSPPMLTEASYNVLYTELLPHGTYLEVKGASPPANQSISNISIVSAVYYGVMNVNLTRFHYLNLTVRTDSPEIMVRVVIWTDERTAHTVLLTNYDEMRWHQVIIDLKPFGITGNSISKIEMGYMITISSEVKIHSIEFGKMSFEEVD